MPVYLWKGVGLHGAVHRGTLFARSYDDLKRILADSSIGLLKARRTLFHNQIPSALVHQFYCHLASLLRASIPVHAALLIIEKTVRHTGLRGIVHDCAALIAQGIPLSRAVEIHGLSDELCSALIAVGEKTGDVGSALQQLIEHRAVIATFKARVRAALIGPLITLIFFLMIMLGIFLFIIPRFESYFASYNEPLPFVTMVVLAFSNFLRSWAAIGCLGGALVMALAIAVYLKTVQGKRVMHVLMLKIPLVGSFMLLDFRTRVLQMLGMLLRQGVPLFECLELCMRSSSNSVLKDEIASMRDLVGQGQALSIAWQRTVFACPETEAFLTIGESSGQLGRMIEHALGISQQRVYSIIDRWVSLVQPAILVVLGVLIASLICAVYMPLLTLSSFVG